MRRLTALLVVLFALSTTNLLAVGEARIQGKVTDAVTNQPVSGVIVTVNAAKGAPHSFHQEFKASKDGSYAVFVLDGTISYDFTWSAPGYQSYTETRKLQLGQGNTRDIGLQPVGSHANEPQTKEAKADVDPAVAAYNEGASLANQGKVDEAIAKLEQAVAAKPDLTAGYQALAHLYMRQKNYPKAIENANRSITIDPDDVEMNEILFDAYNATGDTAKAAQFKSKIPANPTLLFNDAAKLINAGKDAEAEPLLKQAIAADEKFAPAYYELGMLYVRTSKNAEAKTYLEKYIELAPQGKDVTTAKEMLKYVK